MNTKIKIESISPHDPCPLCGKPLRVDRQKGKRYLICTAHPYCKYKYTGSITSILVDDTEGMERERRIIEQEGHRKRGRVNARDHEERAADKAQLIEGNFENNILEHPALKSQKYDGIDTTVNPAPDLNDEARMEFDNERREQEKEKQHRLGNMPGMSNTFNPRPT